MSIQVYGHWAFDPATKAVIKADGTKGPTWWLDYPSFPNDSGIAAIRKIVDKLQFMSGRKVSYRVSDGSPVGFMLQIHALDDPHVIAELNVGLELDLLARNGDQQYTTILKEKLESISEQTQGGNE